MRIPGLRRSRGDEPYEQVPSQVICPVCGLRNDALARFCRNCGLPLGTPRDPVRGTTSRRADLPSDHGTGIAAIVGLLAAVVVLAGAGFLILRGTGGGTPGPTATPTATVPDTAAPQTPRATLPPPSPDASGGLPSPRATRAPTAEPRPSASSKPRPTIALADTGFSCDVSGFDDPTRGRWRLTGAGWDKLDRMDELSVHLERMDGKGRTDVSMEFMEPAEVEQRLGLDAPPTDRALVLTFDGPVGNASPGTWLPDMRAIEYLEIAEDAEGITILVLGVNTEGCARMYVPDWQDGGELVKGDTVDLLLDVKYR